MSSAISHRSTAPSSPKGTALRTTAVVCAVAGLVLIAAAAALTAYTEATCHELYGRSLSEIPVGEWPPSTSIYLSVGAIGLVTALIGVICAGVALSRRSRRASR
jgi:hypothetical protein